MQQPSKKYRIGVEVTLDVIGGKWKSLILYHLVEGVKRYNELKRLIPNVSPKMLTQQLRELERDGLLIRRDYEEVPPRVEYALSEYGSGLIDVLDFFCHWGEAHLDRVYGDRSLMLEDDFADDEHREDPAVERSAQTADSAENSAR
ncbi:helix-turn-helix domain-containing protein [Saccharibacillus sp. CPCC 101409]|uniref:winged helix-turn-helix transcriptional regulator n=1 Tax=Saccharibacillus sp. CPCC 101409 TaxID=3058041 RepID=UPI0026720A0D|nr:helix-turn-helix domain-containing protein [Saccharibacillus sp. CPCC 101409]MDO3408235.1 helix-turn-helix domain-containing protein [Saccharibacillus sp. CPCC 101409]